MTTEQIAVVAGIILSVAFEYLPRVREWYDNLDSTTKKLIMLGLGFVVVAGAYGLSCAQLFGVADFTCDAEGAQVAIQAFIKFVLANQTFYALILKGRKRSVR